MSGKAVCDVCGEKFKNKFAVNGHKKMKNDAAHRAWREKNIETESLPEAQKHNAQFSQYPAEVLEKAQELVENEARDKIINEHYRTVIQPKFDRGLWLDNEQHQSVLNKKDAEHQQEISSITAFYKQKIWALENQIRDLNNRINNLNYHNQNLYNDLNNCQEISLLHKEKMKLEKENFEVNKTNQNKNLKAIWSKLIDLFNGNHKKELELEKQKKKVLEREDALDIKSKKIDDKLNILNKTQREIELKKENIVKDQTSIEKTKGQQKDTQEKFTVLHPVSFSGQPVLQPGISQRGQSATEAIVVECSGEPAIQSGISSVYKSGEELKVFGSNGEYFSQSGVST